jgi:hypothetical protein
VAEALAVALSLAPRALHNPADPLLPRRLRSPWHRSPAMTAKPGRCSRTLETPRRDPGARVWAGQRADPYDDEVWPFLLGQLDDA